MIHELPLERRTLHGHFSSALPPVLAVDPGDSIRFKALSAGWRWERVREWLADRDRAHFDSGHPLSGPIEVRGARAGETLVVGIDEVQPGDWGVTFGNGEAFHWTIDADAALATDEHGNTVSLAPFLGVIGMPPPDDPGVWSTARRGGGAATSTASCSSRARRCSCRSPSTAPCCRRATVMRGKATARSLARRSSVRSSTCS